MDKITTCSTDLIKEFVDKFQMTFKNCSREQFINALEEIRLNSQEHDVDQRAAGPYSWEWRFTNRKRISDQVKPPQYMVRAHTIHIRFDTDGNINAELMSYIKLDPSTLEFTNLDAFYEGAELIERFYKRQTGGEQ